MSKKERELSYERVTSLLDFFPDSGLFVWKDDRGRGMKGKVAGSRMAQGHICIAIDKKYFYAHRLAWFYVHKEWPPHFIDHINGVRDDNRVENLRLANRSINAQNQHKAQRNNRTGLLGVVRVDTSKVWRSKQWRAFLHVEGKQRCLGYFTTEQEAHAAYIDAKRKHHVGCSI